MKQSIAELISKLSTLHELTVTDIVDSVWLALQFGAPSHPASPSNHPEYSSEREENPPTPRENPPPQPEEPVSPKEPEEKPRHPVFHPSDTSEHRVRGYPFQAAVAPSLPHRLNIERALRPLMRANEIGVRVKIDETDTANRIAETRIWLPVLRPDPEKWLDICVIVEDTLSTAVWNDAIIAFVQLLKRQGAFRNVRTFTLQYEHDNVLLTHGYPIKSGKPLTPKALVDPSGRRLYLVMTTGMSDGWRNGCIAKVLQRWRPFGIVSILQLLPSSLWTKTALAGYDNDLITIRSPYMGAPNTKHEYRLRSNGIRQNSKWFTEKDAIEEKKVHVPIFSMTPRSLQRWANFITDFAGTQISGCLLSIEPSPSEENIQVTEEEQLRRLKQFRLAASGDAVMLAEYLSAAQFISLPIARLLQQGLLPNSERVHLAEVLLSGLLYRDTNEHQQIGKTARPSRDNGFNSVNLKFYPAVQDELLTSVPRAQMYEVLERVGDYLEKYADSKTFSISALLKASIENELEALSIPVEAREYACAVLNVLSRKDVDRTELVHPTIIPDEEAVSASLDDIRELMGKEKFVEAAARLELLSGDYTPALQRSVDQVRNDLAHRRRQAVTELETAAHVARNSSPRDPVRERGLWLSLLQIDPEHGTAQDELAKLDALSVDAGLRRELAELRSNLGEIKHDIKQVEAARLRVEQISNDRSFRSPDLRQDAQELYELLDKQRNTILRASDGGTSAERAGNYEQAIETYRQAILQNLTIIVDDGTSEPIEVAPALRRAREAYFQDLLRRAEQRYNEAERSLAEGGPELAVERLENAQGLLEKVEEGGDEARSKVSDLLEKARRQQRQKEEADKLVQEADQVGDPAEARRLLLRAQQIYPGYPQLEARLENKRRQVVRKVLIDMRADLSRAQGLLDQREFEQARTMCRQIMQHGQGLDIEDPDYETGIEQAQEMLDKIIVAERRGQELRQTLDAVQKAIEDQNVPLAQRYLDNLDVASSALPEVIELRTQVNLLGDNDLIWSQAQRAFTQSQNYAEVIPLCEKLESSPVFRERARELRLRAQARLWQRSAGRSVEHHDTTAAAELYEKIIGLRADLPATDAAILDEATANLAHIREDQQRAMTFQARMEDLRKARLAQRWQDWQAQLSVLEETAPDALHNELAEERSTGIEEWRLAALHTAHQALQEENPERWRTAYEQVQPLYELGALDRRDSEYQHIALNFHRHEAERWEASSDPRDLERAVEHRLNARNLAEPPALAEKAALLASIRRRALRSAQFAATNPGPQAAVETLQQQLVENEFELKEDAEVRCALLRYALQAQDFTTAQEQAKVLQFVTGFGERARGWQQATDALATFYADSSISNWEQGVSGLLRVREQAAAEDPELGHLVEDFSRRLVDYLQHHLEEAEQAAGNAATLERVRIYDLILRLEPDDPQARSGMVRLADRLQQISREVLERARALSQGQRDVTGDELAELETLDGELSALQQAFILIEGNDSPVVQNLRQAQRRIQQRLQDLREFERRLESLEEEWLRVVQETWDSVALNRTLTDVTNAARQAGVEERLETWRTRCQATEERLEELQGLLRTVEQQWVSEDYAKVVDACSVLADRLAYAQMALSTDGLTLPVGQPNVYDAYAGRRLQGLDEIRRAADKKARNLTAWQAWAQQVADVQKDARISVGEMQARFEQTPPCLTDGRSHLEALIRHYERLKELLEAPPSDPQSGEAARIAAPLQQSDLIERVERQRLDEEARLAEVDQTLADLVVPLDKLRNFVRGGPNFQNKTILRTYKRMILEIYQVDACYPSLRTHRERYEHFAEDKI